MSELLKPEDVRRIFPNRDPVDNEGLIKKARELFDLVRNHQTSHRLVWYPDHVTTMDLIGQYTLQLDVYYTGEVELSINTEVDKPQLGEERGKALMFQDRILPLTGYNGKTEYWAPTPGIGEIILFTYRPA
jgi:hypothetical protein